MAQTPAGEELETSSPALRKGEKTRAKILEAAEEVFGEKGYHEASIVEITSRAGTALGTFYVHFTSKKAIFDELIRSRGAELHEVLRTAGAGAPDPRSMQSAGFRAYFEWISRHPAIYRVARQAEFVDPALIHEFYTVFADAYAGNLEQAMERGVIPRGNPVVLAWSVMGMADFVAMRYSVWEGGRPLGDDHIDDFIEIGLRSLGFADPTPAGN